jgi:hypothetical protein
VVERKNIHCDQPVGDGVRHDCIGDAPAPQ